MLLENLKVFRRALAYLPRYRKDLLKGYACLFPSSLPDLAAIWLIGHGLDEAVAGTLTTPRILLIVGGVLGLSALYGLLRFGMRWYLVGVSRSFELDVRNEVFAKLLSLPPSYFARSSTGDLVSRMTADVEAVRMTLGPGLMYVASTLTVLPVVLTMMMVMDAALTAWMLLPMGLLAVVLAKLSPSMDVASKATQKAIGELSGEAVESFSGIRILKIFVRERQHGERMRGHSQAYLDSQMQLARARARVTGLLDVIKDLGLLVILGVGSLHALSGRLTVGDFFKFYGLLLRSFWPLIALGWMIAMMHRGAAAMQRIAAVLDEKSDLEEPPAGTGSCPGDLEWDRVTVHRHGVPALDGVSLRVPEGSSLGITGRTGSGKSTLAALLPRLLDPDSGTVRIGGIDVRDWSLSTLRSCVAFVPQEAFLFSETLRDNLRFARPESSDVAVMDAVHRAALDRDLEDLDEGLDTRIGERGLTLSGGQRQRATIARSLLKDAPILVLDDCLSAVDAETEATILQRLRHTFRGRTTVVISHRLAALRGLDRIVVLDAGRIVESGTHAELVAAGGLYAELERRQALERELDRL